ncbi:MAG: hypothetical protein GXO69_00295 [Acidobacteria bacterium]|nr:hypothetical protein [Acidobacteriota bacterium]
MSCDTLMGTGTENGERSKRMRFIIAMSVLFLLIPKICMAKGCEQNEKEMKLLKAYIAVTANPSDNNVNRFCKRLDEWGYPNYFSFTQTDLRNNAGSVIKALMNYAKLGKPKAIESLLKSEIIVLRDNNVEYSEWLGEEIFFIGSKNLPGLFTALKKQEEPVRNYTLYLLKFPVSDNLNKKLILKQLKNPSIRRKYPDLVECFEKIPVGRKSGNSPATHPKPRPFRRNEGF